MPYPLSAARPNKGIKIPVIALASDGFSGALTDGLGHVGLGGAGLTWTGATWTPAGGVVANTPTPGAEIVPNGNMETGDPPTGWNDHTANGTVSSQADERTGGAGLACMQLLATDNSAVIRRDIATAITANLWYGLSYWYKVTGSVAKCTILDNGWGAWFDTGWGSSTTWVNIIRAVRATVTGSIHLYLSVNDNTYIGKFDDVSLVPLTLASLFRSLSLAKSDVSVEAKVTMTTATQAGVVVNLDSAASPANFVIGYHDGTNAHLDKCVAGVYTSKVSAAATYGAGKVLKVVKSGTTYKLYYDGAQIGTDQTIDDAGIISNTIHGLFSTYAANSFDNFVVWEQ